MTTPSSDVLVRPDFDALERAYSPIDRWTCRVCGAAMQFASSDRDGTKYVCSVASAGVFKPYSQENSEHYERSSRWAIERHDHPDMIALLAYARAAAEKIETLEQELGETRGLLDNHRQSNAYLIKDRDGLKADLTRAREEAGALRSLHDADHKSMVDLMNENTALRETIERLAGAIEDVGALAFARERPDQMRMTIVLDIAVAAAKDARALSGSTSTETSPAPEVHTSWGSNTWATSPAPENAPQEET